MPPLGFLRKLLGLGRSKERRTMTAAEFGRNLALFVIVWCGPADVDDLRVSARIPPNAPNFGPELFYLLYFIVCTSVEAWLGDKDSARVALLQAFTNELLTLASARHVPAVPVSLDKLTERYVGYNRVWQSAWQRHKEGGKDPSEPEKAPQTAVAWTFLVSNGVWPPQKISDILRDQLPEELRAASPEVEETISSMNGFAGALTFMEVWIGVLLVEVSRLLNETVGK